MIRAAFLSMGLYVVLCGAGLFFVDRITLTPQVSDSAPRMLNYVTSAEADGRRRFDPPDWLPFTCIGIGGVTMLYAVALPRH